MKTNFFENINGLAFQGNLNLTIAKCADNKLTVSVLLANDLPDKAARIIPPMLLKGEATELDEGFFSAISEPLAKTTLLFANMEAYNKSVELAREKSRMENDKKAKKDKVKIKSVNAETTDDEEHDDETPETDNLFSNQEVEKQQIAEKKKRYDEAMLQITELNKQCKYKEALALLPDAEEYPDKAAELEAKRQGLEKRQKQYEELMQDI
jgi:PRTRC genetic system protein E